MSSWRWVGDRALLRTFDGDLAGANASARALASSIRAGAAPEIEDVVPGARTVLVVLRPGADPPDLSAHGTAATDRAPRAHAFEVVYDGADLDEVARRHAMSAAEVVALHAEPTYAVAFLGFAPGFPYLIGLSPRLATPRLTTPRARVPAGSVAIGGEFTGIYPGPSPGGWLLLGRISADLFDPAADPPALLAPGDVVRFHPA